MDLSPFATELVMNCWRQMICKPRGVKHLLSHNVCGSGIWLSRTQLRLTSKFAPTAISRPCALAAHDGALHRLRLISEAALHHFSIFCSRGATGPSASSGRGAAQGVKTGGAVIGTGWTATLCLHMNSNNGRFNVAGLVWE